MRPASSAFAEEHSSREKKLDKKKLSTEDEYNSREVDLQDHRKLEKTILFKLDIR